MGSSRGGGGVGLKDIPMASRKMVLSLKEIVNNCSESEIYAMLQDCNMDPNEAVNRLLSQDPFHEVKSKREKKKENKDTSEGRTRGASSTSSRSGRSGTDRYGRGGSAQFSYSESGTSHGKPAYKKENSSAFHAGSLSSAPGLAGDTNKQQSAPSDAASNDNKASMGSSFDGISPAPQPSSAYQSAWVGVPGQVSMADIVKMGRPQNKAPGAQKTSQHHVQGPSYATSHHNLQFPEYNASKVSDVNPQSGVNQQVTVDDEWPLIEPPSAASVPSGMEPPADTELHPDPSEFPYDRIDSHDQGDEIQAVNDGATENLAANHVDSASVSSRKMQESSSGGVSLFDNDLYKNMGSFQAHNQAIEHHEVQEVGVSVSSVTANFEQLNIQEEDRGLPSEGNSSSVVIPDHLQVQTADCSHLSFGSFRVGAAVSAPLASMPVKTNLEEATREEDASSVGHSEARTSEYYGDESFRNASDGNLYQRAGASSSNYDSASASQQEALKPENPEIEHGHQYAYPSSTPGYAFENTQQVNAAFSQSQTSSQTQNLASFPNVMAYTNSPPSTLLAANVHPGRESDLQYSPFPITQSMPEKYGNAVSSISDPAISMPEALKNVGLSSAQPTQHHLSGTSVATGPSLPQHLAMHPYSQPTLPLAPFTNMIGYPFLPQNYTYMPSAFQQGFAGNSTYHQSLAAVLPQYKNSVSVSSLPQSATVASGYGAFGNTTTIPGNFPMNPPAAPSGTTLGYDDVLTTQYKDNSHLMSLQQSDNSAMWLQGPGSRSLSAVPASTYYSFQGKNQQVGGFRQGQQPSQNYGTVGYPNFYHSQTGMSLDHQQQNPREASLGGSQGQPKQSQQIWQNSY